MEGWLGLCKAGVAESWCAGSWFWCSVNYEVRLVDGFYDCWGEFPELAASADGSPEFPSLRALKKLQLEEGDLREVRYRPLQVPVFSLERLWE